MTRWIHWMLVSIVVSTASAAPNRAPTRNFDSFGDVSCESEQARLDNLAFALENDPASKAAVIFYGGQIFRGRLPRQGEAAMRAARIKTYLVKRRNIPPEQIIMIDGGFMKEWYVEIWIVPPGAATPQASPTIPADKTRFRSGKVSPRTFQCKP